MNLKITAFQRKGTLLRVEFIDAASSTDEPKYGALFNAALGDKLLEAVGAKSFDDDLIGRLLAASVVPTAEVTPSGYSGYVLIGSCTKVSQ